MLPSQKAVLPLMVMVGNVFTVMVVDAVFVQPLTSVTVTPYVPALVTVISEVLAPLLQVYDTPPVAVSVVLLPSQKVVLPLIVTVGSRFTVRVRLIVESQPAGVFNVCV